MGNANSSEKRVFIGAKVYTLASGICILAILVTALRWWQYFDNRDRLGSGIHVQEISHQIEIHYKVDLVFTGITVLTIIAWLLANRWKHRESQSA